ncbi:MAG: AMP-binding protein [Patulibacter sp.]|nr:AMP-binding protein [Patulibacter sp.]
MKTELPEEFLGFWRAAERAPDRPALTTSAGVRMTYGELLGEVNRTSHGLRNVAGVEPGGTVASVMGDTAAMMTLYLAAMQSGIYLVTVNHHLSAPDIGYILENSGAAAVVFSERAGDRVREAVALAGIDGSRAYSEEGAGDGPSWADLLADQPTTRPEDPRQGSVMQYTSGTTGRPKGVKRALSGKDADSGSHVYEWLFREYRMDQAVDAWLVQSPLYHSANITVASGCLHLGGRLVLMDGWAPELCLELIERERITGTHMVPTQFSRLLQLPTEVRDRYDVSSLRCVVHGAAPCPVEVKRRIIAWLGPVVVEYYGSTEVGTTLAFSEDWLQRPGTVGRPSAISELKILDDEGNELPAGEVGTVYMRQGDDQFEYHGDPGKTAATRHGRLLTVGDLGYVDEDGFLFLTGRKSELIISGGVNLYPAEIEGALIEAPVVRDVAVLGMKHVDMGEVPVAFVTLAAGIDRDEALARLDEHCAHRLSRQQRPREVFVRDELPRDPNGKLYKQRLRAWLDETHDLADVA